MAPRWKGKVAESKALADPMSGIISRLQSSLTEYNSQGLLSGCSLLLAAHCPEQSDLLNQACFGRPVISTEKEKQWFQLSLEEAFYLCCILKCIKIVGESNHVEEEELWRYMISQRANFPILCKAYTHLRAKNWVVRAGSQYGVDFIAYRHHPALVHAEYAVLVLSGKCGDVNGRLNVWSDFHCTLRLCGSVVKTLLVLHVDENGSGVSSPECLEHYLVEERVVTRWNPEQSRENQKMVKEKESPPLI